MFEPFFPFFIQNDKLATSFVVSPNGFSLNIDMLRSVGSEVTNSGQYGQCTFEDGAGIILHFCNDVWQGRLGQDKTGDGAISCIYWDAHLWAYGGRRRHSHRILAMFSLRAFLDDWWSRILSRKASRLRSCRRFVIRGHFCFRISGGETILR